MGMPTTLLAPREGNAPLMRGIYQSALDFPYAYKEPVILQTDKPINDFFFIQKRNFKFWCYVRKLLVIVVASQRTCDAIITPLLRQNDVATWFWRNDGIIITSRVRSNISKDRHALPVCLRQNASRAECSLYLHKFVFRWHLPEFFIFANIGGRRGLSD